jgi:hypothetical protein
MTAPVVMLVALAIVGAGSPGASDISPPTAQTTAAAQTDLSADVRVSAEDADLAREPPAGSGAEFVRYASPPEFHNGLVAGGLFAWAGVLIGVLMFLEKRRLVSLVLGGGGIVVGLALMLTG